MFVDIGLLLRLQELRGSFLDSVLLEVTDFVVSPVMYIFVAVLYWCFNKGAATYLAMNLSTGMLVNQLLKNIFCIYRPWIRNPGVVPLEAAKTGATGYSFPSGHTQIAASEFLSVAHWQRKRKWIVALCIFMPLLVMFTRMYLGVHTLQDVVASFLISLIVLFVSAKLLHWVEGGEKRDLYVLIIGLVLTAAMLTYTALKPYPRDFAEGILLVDPADMITDCYAAAGCASGFLIGWFLERRFLCFKTDVSAKARFGRAIFGSVVLYVCAAFARGAMTNIHRNWGEFIFFFFAFVYILFIYPLIFTMIEEYVAKKKQQ
ncbi:MAG: phosphatase PAP2 family protein [Ruminococcaceae bacterium]|nr:phosphatase PAP2 family protein [Oscillospiraceae bacterium]